MTVANNNPQVQTELDEKKGASRKTCKPETAVIEFLRSCTQFEADAIRIMVSSIDNRGNVIPMNAEDTVAVNNYLNFGFYKEDGNDPNKMRSYRMERFYTLMDRAAQYLENKAHLTTMMRVFGNVAQDGASIQLALQRLQPRPIGGKPGGMEQPQLDLK